MALSIFNSEKRVLLTSLVIIIGVVFITVFNLILYFGKVHGKVLSIEEKKFWVNKLKPAEKYDVVFLGDSRCLLAVNPDVIDKKLKTKSFNFSFAAGGLNSDIFDHMEKNILSTSKDTGKVIVLGITSRSLTVDAEENKLFHITVADSQREFNRWNMIGTILFAKPDFEDLSKLVKKEPVTVFYHKNGWLESTLETDVKAQKGQFEFTKTFFQKASFSEKSLNELFARVEKWKKAGIYVFAFRPPTLPEIDAAENTWNEFSFEKFKLEFEKRGGIWIEVKNRNRYHAYDGSHLNSREANIFTKELAEAIECYMKKSK